jgi:hypothetical protein
MAMAGLSSCGGPSPAARHTHGTASTTTRPAAEVPACAPSGLSASLDFTQIGGSNTAPAGALLLHNTSAAACSLTGVPDVQVVNAGGQPIAVHEQPSVATDAVPAVLAPQGSAGGSGRSAVAGSSLTWSSWTCTAGTYSLTVRFPGWTSSVPAPPPTTAPADAPVCAPTDQTIYVGPVTTLPG